jgi:hypothetical protein
MITYSRKKSSARSYGHPRLAGERSVFAPFTPRAASPSPPTIHRRELLGGLIHEDAQAA